MRLTLTIDSATAKEARDVIVAFQRTRDIGPPLTPETTLIHEPTVRMMGIGWGVTLPPLCAERLCAIVDQIPR